MGAYPWHLDDFPRSMMTNMHQPHEMGDLSRRGGGGVDAGLGPLWPPAVARHTCLPILATPSPHGRPQGPPLHPTPLPPLRAPASVLVFSAISLLRLMLIG